MSALVMFVVWAVERMKGKTKLGFWKWMKEPDDAEYDAEDLPGI